MSTLIKNTKPLYFFALTCVAGVACAAERPNILFIAMDDMRPEMGAYGIKEIRTPNLDHIAQNGMTFHRAYVQQAVCSPSRSSVMTGTRPDTTKVWDLATSFRKALPDVVTLGQHFKQNGYFVQGMGKIYHGGYNDEATWSTPWVTPAAPKYAAELTSPAAKIKEEIDPDDLPEGAKKPGANGKSKNRGPVLEMADVPDNTFTDGKVADLAITSLSTLRDKKTPFFLAVGFIRPHLPFVAPKKYWDMYDPAKIPMAPNRFTPKDAPSYAIRNVLAGGEVRLYKDMPEGVFPDTLARQLKHGYYASTSYMDAQIGRVMAELDRLDLRKNTIVVLWGDHGWKLGEHDGWAKHGNVENDTNAPLIISYPGMKNTNTHSDALVELVDLYPTITELAGLPLPTHLEGRSFKPVLEDPARAWKSAAFSQYPRPKMGNNKADLMGYTMRTERYRFTVWHETQDASKIDAIELYDHQLDPQENTNIAKLPANTALVERLMAQWKSGWKGAIPKL